MPVPKAISLVGVCPHCGESVELLITKKHAKIIWKGFKIDIREAQLSADNVLALDYQKMRALGDTK